MTQVPSLLVGLSALLAGGAMFCLAFAINIIGSDLLAHYLYSFADWTRSEENWPLVVD